MFRKEILIFTGLFYGLGAQTHHVRLICYDPAITIGVHHDFAAARATQTQWNLRVSGRLLVG